MRVSLHRRTPYMHSWFVHLNRIGVVWLFRRLRIEYK